MHRRRRRRVRLAGRFDPRHPAGKAPDLRGARQGFHRPPFVRRRAPGDLPRLRGEDPAPAASGDQRGRAAAGARTLQRGPSPGARAHELLGVQLARVLRPGTLLQHPLVRRLPGLRVQDHGARAAPRRDQGHPRRRLQPHRGRERAGPNPVAARHRQPDLLRARRTRRAARPLLLELHRHRQRPRRRAAGGDPPDHGLAALLGLRDARGRLPLRPRLGAGPGRGRHVPGQPPASSTRSRKTPCCRA